MTLQEKILVWVRDFEPWKRTLFLRAASEPRLSDEATREIADLLLGKASPAGGEVREITPDDLPEAADAGEPMAIRAISDLVNVNALAPGQVLEFEPRGLNVVYGKNGAGKTGYSRVLKHAGRTLHPETVLAHVGGSDGRPPSSTITVAIGEGEVDFRLDLEKPAPGPLGRICIADTQAGSKYLTTDTAVDFAPAALRSLSRLGAALKALEAELDFRQEALCPIELDLSRFGEQTAVRRLLEREPDSTSDQDLRRLMGLSDEEEERLGLLRRCLAWRRRTVSLASRSPGGLIAPKASPASCTGEATRRSRPWTGSKCLRLPAWSRGRRRCARRLPSTRRSKAMTSKG